VRRIDVVERRARLGRRHHLAPAAVAASVVEVAGDLAGLHGTDPASVFLAARARLRPGAAVADVERALYEERALVRMLGMRRTMFVVPLDLAPLVQAACTRAIAVKQRELLVGHLEQAGIGEGDAAGWLAGVEESVVRALRARGEAFAADLAGDEPRLRTPIVMAEGKPYEAAPYVSTRVLFLLSADGRIVRGRPRGSWVSSQYRWSPTEAWLPGGIPELPVEAAQVELARRWLRAFGPAPVTDLRWWTGWSAGTTKKALAQLNPVEVDLGGVTGLLLAEDVEPVDAPEPYAAVLPALDPTPMGWNERGWFLGRHKPALFDRSGNIGPSIWWGGRIVGGWAQRKGGEVVHRLLEDVGADAVAAVEAELTRLTDWLTGVRVTPRFPAPLDRELTA